MEMVRRIGAFALNLEKSMFSWMKTALLMAGITALFGALGGMIGGQQGMLMALGFALLALECGRRVLRPSGLTEEAVLR